MNKRISIAAALAVTALSAGAQADDRTGILEGRHRHYETPQHFAFEFRVSPFTPQIDSEPGLTGTPYQDTFGTMKRALVAVEMDWQAIRIPHLGTLGPGLSVGYTEMSDVARLASDPSQKSAEDTSLSIFPFYAVAVLRADVLMRDFRIPLVPFIKAGVGYALWRASNSLGTSSYTDPNTSASVSGKGHTFGTHAAGGIALDLNTFDKAASVNLDNSVGINHTYLFAEYMFMNLTGIGQSHALYVGDNTYTIGLAFEF